MTLVRILNTSTCIYLIKYIETTSGHHIFPLFSLCADFGVDTLVKMIDQTTFPWLMSNVIDNITEEPLAQGLTKHMIEWQGKKVRRKKIVIF